ncbi:PVC-type heme-binding CxxCH protein [Paludisphaera sp.]|uniref:PVC-type heme-binding CxxCH protein n=1 Tax=Paludisphaera sp. TaxID=2017432 RepID=UPI00301D53F2
MTPIVPLLVAAAAFQAAADPPTFPRTPPTGAAEAPATFRTRLGLRMELIAAEPLVLDPVAAAYDEDGRLYVVEMSDYPHVEAENDVPFKENTLDPPLGRLKLLEDRDGDGRFDAATIVADRLSWPTGLAIWKGGVFVAATPDVWYIKDADGDGRAEIRERVFEGFRKLNVQAVMNNLVWGLDHKIYGAGSSNGGEIRRADRPDAPGVPIPRRDFRFDPTTREFEAVSGGARFGNTFDDWGNRFLCDIRNPAEHVVLPARYLARNPRLAAPRVLHDVALAGDAIPVFRISPPEPWREFRARRWAANGKVLPRSELIGSGIVTSSSGVTVYRGDAYPPETRGQIFVCEVANNLIHRQAVEPDGVTFRGRRADEGGEIVASTDTWFRPVNFVHAPDGTLHVLDMYRETIEHPWSIPDDIKATLDLRAGEDRGRIYRLAPPDFQPRPAPRLSAAATAELVALLSHRNAWHRDTAHRLIHERQDPSAVAPLRALLRESAEPLARLHALWSLDGLGSLADDDLLIALGDDSPGVREHAVALAEPRIGAVATLRERVIALADDPGDRVRFQVAFTLGEVAESDPRAVAALASVARRDAADPWRRTAVLSSAGKSAVPLFEAIVADDPAAADGLDVLLRDLATLVGASGDLAEAGRFLERLAAGPVARGEARRLDAVLLGLGEGMARGGRKTFRDAATTDPAARAMLDSALARATSTAADGEADLADRERAVALLGQSGFAASGEVLASLLTPGEPQRIQLGATRTLATFPDDGVAPALLSRWPSLPPAVRTEALTRLLSRPSWTVALLDAVEAGAVPASVIPPARRALLLDHRDAKIRDRANALLAAAAPAARAAAYERYRPALDLPADSARGGRVFERECMSCHRLGDQGKAVGPNLASVQRRTPDEVLLHIVDPNREVAPEFLEYTVAMDDGRVLSGMVAEESSSALTLRRSGGEEDTVPRSGVEAIVGTGKSLMPEGLEERIDPGEMADLIAFILGVQQ